MLILEKTLKGNNSNKYTEVSSTRAIKKDKNLQEVMFNKYHKLYLPNFDKTQFDNLSESEVDEYIESLNKLNDNINNYGFQLSAESLDHIIGCNLDTMHELEKGITDFFKKSLGSRKNMNALYESFEKEVNNFSYIKSFNDIFFNITKIDNLKIIDLATDQTILDEFLSLSRSPLSYGENEKVIINSATNNVECLDYLPEKFNNKENMAFCFSNILNKYSANELKNVKVETSTDVLRIAVGMSDGDISLSDTKNLHFKSFKNQERKMLMNLLEKTNPKAEEFMRHKTEWLKFGETIHPGSYHNCKKTNHAFYKFRNQKVRTFYSDLEESFKNKDIDKTLSLLTSRPGDFARNLNRTLVTYENDNEKICRKFLGVMDSLEPKTLLELNNYLLNRNNDNEKRLFTIKGNDALCYTIDNNLPKINQNIVHSLRTAIEETFVDKMKEAAPMGKVYIDESMKNYAVPNTNRNVSSGLQSVGRGTNFELEENSKKVRLFCHWVEPNKERVDIDLSATIYDENFHHIGDCSYYHTNFQSYGIMHSGDFTSAPASKGGATEYIDIDLKTLESTDAKYIGVIINAYTSQNFSELPECYAGVMENPEGLFDVKSVLMKSDITSNSTQNVMMIYDVDNHKAIWLDMNVPSYSLINNVHSSRNNSLNLIKSVMEKEFTSVYDLALLNARARGDELVDVPEKADTIISLNGNITPYNVDELLVPEISLLRQEKLNKEKETEIIIENDNIEIEI